jgi:flagellar hook-associated protein 3 FlgL
MRVTQTTSSYDSLAGLQSAASRLASLQAQMSSGQQITTPSDDPSGTVQALQLRGELKRNTHYATNSNDALAWMSTSDTTYSQIVKLAQSARSITLQGLNSGTSTGTSNTALADQIDGIRTSLINLANTTYNGRPIFGGTTSSTVAYQPDGTYVGDQGTISRTVGAEASVQINQTGTQVFGDPATGTDLFTALANISSELRSSPSTLSSTDLATLDTAISRVSTAQAAEGATYQSVETAQQVQTSTGTTLTSQLSNIQDIDIADMAIKVSTANVTYQAALQTTASIRQLSLLNFLN